MIARLATGDHRGCCGFDGADAHPFHFLFEYFSNSGNGAAGAHSGDECIDAFELLKQLDSSGLAVHFRVRRIIELLRHEVVAIFLDQFFSFVNRTAHAFRIGR